MAQEEHPGSLGAVLAEALDASFVTAMHLQLWVFILQLDFLFNYVKLSAKKRNVVCAVYFLIYLGTKEVSWSFSLR